jgi:hypothetical protein
MFYLGGDGNVFGEGFYEERPRRSLVSLPKASDKCQKPVSSETRDGS